MKFIEERQKILEDIVNNRNDRHNKRRQQRRCQTEQFLKSMQMLHANAKPDKSQPFEDYSIFLYRQSAANFGDRVKDLEKQFTYVPDHENKLPSQTKGNADEEIATRIKNLEDKWKDPEPVEKKPKDLLRAIGKIETSDWNIKEIEKKIMENKLGKPSSKDKEKVPKWSKEQFLARQTKMEKQHLDRQDSAEAKFADIDKSIKHLELKLKEGTARDLGQNKVASITEKLVSKVPDEPKPVQKTNSRPVVLPKNASEFCHFCKKRVYLMERLSAEGRFFHHGCFRCQYCNTQLRLGSYAFDKDGLYGHKFFCIHHYGMQAEPPITKVVRKPSQRLARDIKSPDKRQIRVAGVDLLDRVQTPERIEFANLSTGQASSDHEDSLSQMDEDEWTDKNFGASAAEYGSSDDESSSLSDTDSDDEDAFEEALEEPATKEGTMKWAELFKKRYSRKRHDSDSNGYSSSDNSSYYENSSEDDDSETATEGEEEIRARELRKQEVRVEPPVVQTDTGTDTEVKTSLNLNSDIPTVISNSHLDPVKNKSSDNLSVNSGEYVSADSGDLDSPGADNSNKSAENIVVGKLSIKSPVEVKKEEMRPIPLSKSATAGSLGPAQKPLRNFVLPPRESRKSFGAEFVPKFKSPEPEPILVIKRTPSKINLPKEVGKPKVAVKSNLDGVKKYFGDAKKPTIPKPPIKRSETAKPAVKPPLVKQASLPEKGELKRENSFNFEPEDSDLKNIDDYIENLIANEDELLKPIDPSKFATKVAPEEELKGDNEKLSSSIEDLLHALKTETGIDDDVVVDTGEAKIDELLNWMDDLNHQHDERKVYKSFSAAKYKNLERVLKKAPQRAASVISKIPRDNINYFERHMAGKSVDIDDSDEETTTPSRSFGLSKSKTDVYCNKPRTSVDLDAVSNVDIKKVLKKFENNQDADGAEKPPPSFKRNFDKRKSFSEFKAKSVLYDDRLRHSKSPDISKMMGKFENNDDSQDLKLPDPNKLIDKSGNIRLRSSRSPDINKIRNKFENPKSYSGTSSPVIERKSKPSESEESLRNALQDLRDFVDSNIEDMMQLKNVNKKHTQPILRDESKNLSNENITESGPNKTDWSVNITVTTIPNPDFIKNLHFEEPNLEESNDIIAPQDQKREEAPSEDSEEGTDESPDPEDSSNQGRNPNDLLKKNISQPVDYDSSSSSDTSSEESESESDSSDSETSSEELETPQQQNSNTKMLQSSPDKNEKNSSSAIDRKPIKITNLDEAQSLTGPEKLSFKEASDPTQKSESPKENQNITSQKNEITRENLELINKTVSGSTKDNIEIGKKFAASLKDQAEAGKTSPKNNDQNYDVLRTRLEVIEKSQKPAKYDLEIEKVDQRAASSVADVKSEGSKNKKTELQPSIGIGVLKQSSPSSSSQQIQSEDICDSNNNRMATHFNKVEESRAKPSVEDLYSKVNKNVDNKKDIPQSPQAPRRNKKPSQSFNDVPPQRPVRKKSVERKANSGKRDSPESQKENVENASKHPVVPQRRKSSNPSPVFRRKISAGSADGLKLPPRMDSQKSLSTNNLSAKKEVVSSYHLPKPQSVDLKQLRNDPNYNSEDPRLGRSKTKDKDCCIQ